MTYNKNLNYCTASPDTVLGVTINHGCYMHDRHYRNERKDRLDRKGADLLLKRYIYRDLKRSNVPFEFRFRLKWKRIKLDIDWTIINKNWAISKTKFMIDFRKSLARPVSNLYYLAVRLFAWPAWVE